MRDPPVYFFFNGLLFFSISSFSWKFFLYFIIIIYFTSFVSNNVYSTLSGAGCGVVERDIEPALR